MNKLLKLIKISCVLLFLCSALFVSQAITAKQTSTINKSQFQRFGTTLSHVKNLYVKDTKDTELFDNAINGMLSGLDPHSKYLNKEAYNDLKSLTSGKFIGLGIQIIQDKNGMIKVITPISGGPAQKAGIKSGDYIVSVNGKTLKGMPLGKAIKLMRGKRGSIAKIKATSNLHKVPRTVRVRRDHVSLVSVSSKMLDNDYGYINITRFQKSTHKKMKLAIAKLKKQSRGKLRGLVLDLRNNPGGLLHSGIEIADAFIDASRFNKKAPIVYTKGRIKSSNFIAYATRGDMISNVPLVVLINGESASASEIVAGALKDHKRAVILGKRSYGKGSVQTVYPLDDNTAIKLTTALYYTPSGKSIHKTGVRPDFIVEDVQLKNTKEDAILLWQVRKKMLKSSSKKYNLKKLAATDTQLFEALKLLKSLHVKPRPNVT